MNDNIKKFMEVVSNEGNETVTQLKDADAEKIISMARERNITITPEDLKQDDEVSELSMDELAATAGGKRCWCPGAGGGLEDKYHYACACVLGGGGDTKPGIAYSATYGCLCVIGGSGGRDDGRYPGE